MDDKSDFDLSARIYLDILYSIAAWQENRYCAEEFLSDTMELCSLLRC